MINDFLNIFRKDTKEKKSSGGTFFYNASMGLGGSSWASGLLSQDAAKTYGNNPTVYRCVTLIARSLSNVPLTLVQNGQPNPLHPWAKRMAQPNAFQNYTAFCEGVITHLLLWGNAFVVASREDEPLPQLYLIPPEKIRLIQDAQGYPLGYEYHHIDGSYSHQVDKDGSCAVLHMKLFNPNALYDGLSPLHAAENAISLQNTMAMHKLSLLKNACCPSGILMTKDQISPEQTEQLISQLQESKGAGTGKMIFLQGDFQWKEMGMSPKDMNFEAGKHTAAREICQVFGIPPVCIGLADATYTNYQEGRLHLWEDTLIPLLDLYLSFLNQWLTRITEEDFSFTYRKESIQALSPRREQLLTHLEKITFLTDAEKREFLGFHGVPTPTSPTL